MHLIIQIHTRTGAHTHSYTHSIGIDYEEKECQRKRHEEIWYMIRIILIISMRWRLIGSGFFFLSPICFFCVRLLICVNFLFFSSSCLPKIGRMSNSLAIFEFTVIRNMHRKFIIFHELNAFNRKSMWTAQSGDFTLHQEDARTMCLLCSVASWYWCANYSWTDWPNIRRSLNSRRSPILSWPDLFSVILTPFDKTFHVFVKAENNPFEYIERLKCIQPVHTNNSFFSCRSLWFTCSAGDEDIFAGIESL